MPTCRVLGMLSGALLLAGCVIADDALDPPDAVSATEQALGGSAPATDYCYGAHGANCDGVPTLSPVPLGGDWYRLPVSVGSQVHDRCCNQAHAGGRLGYMCAGNTDTTECQAEWFQAVTDQLYGYVWWDDFDVTVGTPWSTTAPLAWRRAPAGQPLAVNYARAGWCASGRWHYINLFTQARCD